MLWLLGLCSSFARFLTCSLDVLVLGLDEVGVGFKKSITCKEPWDTEELFDFLKLTHLLSISLLSFDDDSLEEVLILADFVIEDSELLSLLIFAVETPLKSK